MSLAPGLTLPYHWTPRHYQRRAWEYLAAGGKRVCLVWHRRSGKDDLSLHHTACAAHEVVGNYVHLLPEQEQARKAIWNGVNRHTGKRRIDEVFPVELRRTTRDNEMFIEFLNGSTWQLGGSDNYNSIVGAGFAGIVFSEWALANPAAWPYFSPMLVETGGWAIFISTPRGRNHLKKTYDLAVTDPKWFGQLLTNDDTQVFSDEQIADELKNFMTIYEEDYARAMVRQEYFCNFDAAIPGAIWADCVVRAETEGRVLTLAPNRQAKVDTAWDLGRTDDTAIWFYQPYAAQLDIIDHHSSNLKDVEFYCKLLIQKRIEHGITYGTHWLPHDARPRTLGMGAGSILQQFEAYAKRHPEIGKFAIGARLDRQEGIQAARATFPLCRFDRDRCAKGLNSLRHYHREWDEEKAAFRDNPAHDWASHDADAFRYLSLSWKWPKGSSEDNRTTTEKLLSASIGQTYGDLRKKHLRKRREVRESQYH